MLNQKSVYIRFDSGCLGDVIAWMPYVEEYRKKNNYKIICANEMKHLFEEQYKEIQFQTERPYTIPNIVKQYNIGYYLYDEINRKKDPRLCNLQEVASNILGLEYKEIKPKITIKNKKNNYSKPYVCIATQSTSQAKYWNYQGGWEVIVDYLKKIGYEVVCIDKYYVNGNSTYLNQIPNNAINKTGDIDIQERITDLYNCEFFIGLGSGLSWLAWALNKKVIMISGFSDPISEFYTPYRIINRNVCNSCWNDTDFRFPDNKFVWCPKNYDNNKIFECTKSITPEIVISNINQLIKDNL
jgi:autotransporter strand-loop-strand O-heptosyltransferase